MLAVAFDTLKLARKLESGGMPPKQAQDMSATLSDTFTEWLSIGNLATREDLLSMEAKLSTQIQNLDTKLSVQISTTREDMLKTKNEVLRWMLGQTFLILTAMFGLFGFIHMASKP
jgi:hypothetical protein